MKQTVSVILILVSICYLPVAAQKKKKALDFTRDIQPISLSLSAEEGSLVLDWAEAAIGEEIFPLIVIGFFCGLRTAELQRLEWDSESDYAQLFFW